MLFYDSQNRIVNSILACFVLPSSYGVKFPCQRCSHELSPEDLEITFMSKFDILQPGYWITILILPLSDEYSRLGCF